MTRQIVLLRGVNVGGRTLSMAALRASLEALRSSRLDSEDIACIPTWAHDVAVGATSRDRVRGRRRGSYWHSEG